MCPAALLTIKSIGYRHFAQKIFYSFIHIARRTLIATMQWFAVHRNIFHKTMEEPHHAPPPLAECRDVGAARCVHHNAVKDRQLQRHPGYMVVGDGDNVNVGCAVYIGKPAQRHSAYGLGHIGGMSHIARPCLAYLVSSCGEQPRKVAAYIPRTNDYNVHNDCCFSTKKRVVALPHTTLLFTALQRSINIRPLRKKSPPL